MIFLLLYSIHAVIDECAVGLDNCDLNAECTDLPLGFVCDCIPGYTGDGVDCTCT